MHDVSIAYAEPITSYSPIGYEAKNRKYLVNIYEPLVRYDESFNFETSLAVSWGRLDDYTWDFRLREGVYFHDGSSFDANDALYSLEKAMEEESEVASLLSSIESVKIIDDYRLEITTFEPDPLLLNKMTNIYIFPKDYENFTAPNGTGSYMVSGFEDTTLILNRFDDYWGPMPYFEQANLVYIPSTEDRLDRTISGEINVLADVPPQYVKELETFQIRVEDFPSLEVSYLMLNQDGVFENKNLRDAVWSSLGEHYAEELGGGYLVSTAQYAASGIAGYISGLPFRKVNMIAANRFREEFLGDVDVTLDLPLGLDTLGEKIKSDLAKVNINVTLNIMDQAEYEKKISSGDSDMYFFGWKFDLADVADFYESVIHSQEKNYGNFNYLSYNNELINNMIEQSSTLLEVSERNLILSQINLKLLDDKAVVPLFESKVLYAIRPEVRWKVRLDGMILASEIVENVVE